MAHPGPPKVHGLMGHAIESVVSDQHSANIVCRLTQQQQQQQNRITPAVDLQKSLSMHACHRRRQTHRFPRQLCLRESLDIRQGELREIQLLHPRYACTQAERQQQHISTDHPAHLYLLLGIDARKKNCTTASVRLDKKCHTAIV